MSEGFPSTPICPSVVTRSKSSLILTDCIHIQIRKLSGFLIPVSLFKELKTFLSFFLRNPLLPEGPVFFFHSLPPERAPGSG